jgi:hypothetical protein
MHPGMLTNDVGNVAGRPALVGLDPLLGDLAADHPEPLVLGGEPLPCSGRRPLRELQRAEGAEPAAAVRPHEPSPMPTRGIESRGPGTVHLLVLRRCPVAATASGVMT